MTTFQTATTHTNGAGAMTRVYRELGDGGVPLLFLHHLTAVLEDWDPAFVDDVARSRRVILFDNRGVGGSGGATPTSVAAMADDAIEFISALGLTTVDLFGFSLGGFVAQAMLHARPDLIRRVVLTGTGPAGGEGIANVGAVLQGAIAQAKQSGRHPKHTLFFTQSRSGQQAANDYLSRLGERTTARDPEVTDETIGAQLTAIAAWGNGARSDLEAIDQPVLIANGDNDVMVPTAGSFELFARLPNARLSMFPDSGHGGIFQHRKAFVPQMVAFLDE